jgi:hypothetical protein
MSPATSNSYELEFVLCGDPATAIETEFQSPTEVQAFVADALKPNSVLTVVNNRGGEDYGTFIIFLNELGSAHVRLLEHQGFYAKRSGAVATDKLVKFVSDVGSIFTVGENATVPTGTAVEALHYWLACGGQLPTIHWGEE